MGVRLKRASLSAGNDSVVGEARAGEGEITAAATERDAAFGIDGGAGREVTVQSAAVERKVVGLGRGRHRAETVLTWECQASTFDDVLAGERGLRGLQTEPSLASFCDRPAAGYAVAAGAPAAKASVLAFAIWNVPPLGPMFTKCLAR